MLIKNIHRLVLKGIDDQEAGRYRRENVVIAGASTTPPSFLHAEEEMRGLMSWWGSSQHMHPVERAAHLHTRFVEIHPFADGNGRTGRLLLNLELLKAGYPLAIIRKEQRLAYYEALDAACAKGDFDGIVSMVADAVQRTLDEYLVLLPPSPESGEAENPSDILRPGS